MWKLWTKPLENHMWDDAHASLWM